MHTPSPPPQASSPSLDPMRAIQEAKARLRRSPTDADALFVLAEAYARSERHEEAQATHRLLLRTDARYADMCAPESEPCPTGFIGRFDPTPCPVCGTAESQPVWVGNISKAVRTWGHLDPVRSWVRCNDCDTLRVAEPPSKDALTRWSLTQAEHKEPSSAPSTAELSRVLRHWEPELDQVERMGFGSAWLDVTGSPKPRMLEIGSDWGGFLAAASWRGFSVTGVTSATGAAWATRHLGVSTVVRPPGPPTDAHIPQGVFDIIVLRGVMDCTDDPVGLLQTICSRLADGGLVVLELPLRDHPVQRMQGYDAPSWCLPNRRVFFSRATLDVALARAGMCSVDIRQPASPEEGTALVFARRDDLHEMLTTE